MKLILLVSLFLSFGIHAASGNHIGRVVKLKGDVTATNKVSGEERQVHQGDKLFQGDEINSKSGSFAKILMIDDTIFNIGPKSKFIFEKFIFKSKQKRVATYNLVRGKLRSLFTVKSPEKTLKIKTPTASMGIRGTEIVSDVYKVNGIVQTDIALLSGKLEISSSAGGKSITHWIKPGQMYQMGKSSPGSRGVASSSNPIRDLPKSVYKRLKAKPKKGGQVFLFDAKKGVDGPAKADWSFDESIDDKSELRSDDEAKVDKMMNDDNKKKDVVKKIEKFDQKMKSAGIKINSSEYKEALYQKNPVLFEFKKKMSGDLVPSRGPASVSQNKMIEKTKEKTEKAAASSANLASREARQRATNKATRAASKETQLKIQKKMKDFSRLTEQKRRLLLERRRRLELERLRILREQELARQAADSTTGSSTTDPNGTIK